VQIVQAAEIVRSLRLHRIVSNQPQYSMLARAVEREVIPVCEQEGIGQVCFSPLAQGVLTGKYLPGQPPPPGSRAADPKQNQFLKHGVLDFWVSDKVKADDRALERVQKLVKLAEGAGLTAPQMALAWCLRQTNVASVICGASRPEQVDANISASGVTLSSDLLAAIEKVLTEE